MERRPRLAGAASMAPIGVVAALVALAPPTLAFLHDQDQNLIDDRIEAVELDGWNAVFVNSDPNERMRISAFLDTPIRFGINVQYDHHPDATDAATLAATGAAHVRPYLYIDYIRAEANFAQIQAIAALPGVTRVEAIQRLYPLNHVGARTVRARDSRGFVKLQNYTLFPSAGQELGLDGTGIVVAVLDTGVNDAPDIANPGYLGHESLVGKFLGGGEFYHVDPLLNTQNNESMNPNDHGGDASQYHGTHVAGTAIGTGGAGGVFAGVAPAARLVDCKLLSDLGASAGGAALGLEWCVFNMNNDWGLTGPDLIYAGIDVLNLSLGGESTDGDDADSHALNAAVAAGLVIVAASGNLASLGPGIASPAAADSAITVGASTHGKSLDRSDDRVTIFSQTGLRADDGDGNLLDEYKPDVVAPGFGIISANGDYLSEGNEYKAISGTSMASPHVAGCAALLLQQDPTLTQLEIRTILRETAIHGIPMDPLAFPQQQDPRGLDPNYFTGCGWGLVDVYAAALEVANPATGVQVARFRPVSNISKTGVAVSQIDVLWWTQREHTFAGFDVYRAPDVAGAPGTFVKLNALPIPPDPAGDPILAMDDNRTPYIYVDDDPSLVIGETYWYQLGWPILEPPAPVVFGELPRVATAYYSVVHNFADSDVSVKVGTSALYVPDVADYFTFGPGEAQQDSFRLLTPGVPFYTPYANVEHFWSIPFSEDDGVTPFLPPAQTRPWFVNVTEGGFADQSGFVNSFSMFVNDTPGSATGTTYVTDSPTPQPTIEGQQTTLWIPEPAVVPVEVSGFGAAPVSDGVRLVIRIGPIDGQAALELWRAATRDRGAARRVARELVHGDTTFDHVDRSAAAGHSYWYWASLEIGDRVIEVGPQSATAGAGGVTRAALRGPNPVRAASDLRFAYTIGSDVVTGGLATVSVTVHDAHGRRVATLRQTRQSTGSYVVTWDGHGAGGLRAPAGVYFVRFTAGDIVRTARFVLVP